MNGMEIALIVVITLVGLVLLRWLLWLGLFLAGITLMHVADRLDRRASRKAASRRRR